jgi:hypothetical protein
MAWRGVTLDLNLAAAAQSGPKRNYKEGTVEGFLEDIQLDEHVNELVKVRGISSMERLFEVTVQQFYDMDIPTSDLRLLIEEINKRKNPPPPPPVVVVEPAPSEPGEQLDKATTTKKSHNNSSAAVRLSSCVVGSVCRVSIDLTCRATTGALDRR